MKKLLFIAVLSVGYIFTTSSGCQTKDNQITPGNAMSPAPVSGDWKVTFYSNDGSVATADYTEYTFDFKPKEVITATFDQTTAAGYWSISAADKAVRTLNIAFNSGDPRLSQLNNNWEVLNVSETEVRLADEETNRQLYLAKQ
jgi:hypothetical protein